MLTRKCEVEDRKFTGLRQFFLVTPHYEPLHISQKMLSSTLFDEAHKAKNALASGRGEPTQTGQAVIDLQDPKRSPEYRVVYSSATGATDVRNMAYMTRLGLWGPDTSFPSGFQQFLAEIEGGGVGAMEMVSRDMK